MHLTCTSNCQLRARFVQGGRCIEVTSSPSSHLWDQGGKLLSSPLYNAIKSGRLFTCVQLPIHMFTMLMGIQFTKFLTSFKYFYPIVFQIWGSQAQTGGAVFWYSNPGGIDIPFPFLPFFKCFLLWQNTMCNMNKDTTLLIFTFWK